MADIKDGSNERDVFGRSGETAGNTGRRDVIDAEGMTKIIAILKGSPVQQLRHYVADSPRLRPFQIQIEVDGGLLRHPYSTAGR